MRESWDGAGGPVRGEPLPCAPLATGQCATLACLLEVAAPKPGNVHRGADFDDLGLTDFLVGAVALEPAMEAAVARPLGRTVLDAVQSVQRLVGTNTHLGTILLLAPLAAVPRDEPLGDGVARVLDQLTPADARDVFQAIRTARPGGLGHVDEWDVRGAPPADLREAMRSAASRDLVARQYAENFSDVLQVVRPWLLEGMARGWPLSAAIVHCHVRLMHRCPDSLIGRKCGVEVAHQAARRAGAVLAAGAPGDENYHSALSDLDFWLRCDGHRRNPGTTADLIAAGLFAALRDSQLEPPVR